MQNTSYVIYNGLINIEYSKCSYWNECNDKLLNEMVIYKPGSGYNTVHNECAYSVVANYLCNSCRLDICLDLECKIGKMLSYRPTNTSDQAKCYILQSNCIDCISHIDCLPIEMLIHHSDKRCYRCINNNRAGIICLCDNKNINNFCTNYLLVKYEGRYIKKLLCNINCIDLNYYFGGQKK